MFPLSPWSRFLLFSSLLLAVLVGIGAFLLLPTRERTAAAILPARETAALFHGLTMDRLQSLSRSFPLLKDITPPTQGPFDVAVLHLPDGSFGWALFLSENDAKVVSDRRATDTGRFAIRTSSAAVNALLSPKDGALSSSEPFTSLAPNDTAMQPWIYVDARLLAVNNLPGDTVLLQHLAEQPFLLITSQGKQTSVSFVETSAPPSLSSPPLALTPAPSVVLTVSAPAPLLQTLLPTLPEATQSTLDGLVRTTVSATLGEEVSPRYDLLPLLRGTTALYVSPSQSGAGLRFLLATRTEGRNLAETLDDLRARVRASMETAAVRSRTLTNGFRSVTIADDPALVREATEERNGWSVRSVLREDTGAGVITAVSGRRLLLGNDEEWMRQATSDAIPPPLILPREDTNGDIVAGGVGSRDGMRGFLRESLGFSLPSSLLDTFGPPDQRLLWSLSQKGNIMTWEVEGAP